MQSDFVKTAEFIDETAENVTSGKIVVYSTLHDVSLLVKKSQNVIIIAEKQGGNLISNERWDEIINK